MDDQYEFDFGDVTNFVAGDAYECEAFFAFRRADAEGVEIISVDVDDPDNIRNTLEGMRVFLHELGFPWVASLIAVSDNGNEFVG